VGFVVSSIPNSVQGFIGMLHADWDEQIIYDPNQNVRVTFLKSVHAGDPLWELVEPADEKSPVHALAAKGGGLHMFVTSWIIWSRRWRCRTLGAIIARSPVSAVAFGGRALPGFIQRTAADRISRTLI